jgi:hypothetical protein
MNKKKALWFLGIAIVVCGAVFFIQSRDEGYIKLEGKGVHMQLGGAWRRRVSVSSNNEGVQAFAGVYRPRSIQIIAQKDGQGYTISSNGPWGELSRVEVKKDETTVIKCGPPLKAKADVRRSGREVSLGLSVVGCAGEGYSLRSLRQVPGVKIIDEAENVLAEGKFAFG